MRICVERAEPKPWKRCGRVCQHVNQQKDMERDIECGMPGPGEILALTGAIAGLRNCPADPLQVPQLALLITPR